MRPLSPRDANLRWWPARARLPSARRSPHRRGRSRLAPKPTPRHRAEARALVGRFGEPPSWIGGPPSRIGEPPPRRPSTAVDLLPPSLGPAAEDGAGVGAVEACARQRRHGARTACSDQGSAAEGPVRDAAAPANACCLRPRAAAVTGEAGSADNDDSAGRRWGRGWIGCWRSYVLGTTPFYCAVPNLANTSPICLPTVGDSLTKRRKIYAQLSVNQSEKAFFFQVHVL
jgi:hypothetical protein